MFCRRYRYNLVYSPIVCVTKDRCLPTGILFKLILRQTDEQHSRDPRLNHTSNRPFSIPPEGFFTVAFSEGYPTSTLRWSSKAWITSRINCGIHWQCLQYVLYRTQYCQYSLFIVEMIKSKHESHHFLHQHKILDFDIYAYWYPHMQHTHTHSSTL